jgi:hypothetical protein
MAIYERGWEAAIIKEQCEIAQNQQETNLQ